VTRRRERRRRQLLHNITETEDAGNWERKHWLALCRTRFGRGYGPVVKQTTDKWMPLRLRYSRNLTLCSIPDSTECSGNYVFPSSGEVGYFGLVSKKQLIYLETGIF
jgi:hypothetical protein